MLRVFTDGGARGNPGPAGIGVYITDEEENVLYAFGKAIGVATNNIAEYKALIAALVWLVEHKATVVKHGGVNFFLDSLLLVSQINGIYKVKNANLQTLLFTVREKETSLSVPLRYAHVPREKNKHADALVNAALDKQALS